MSKSSEYFDSDPFLDHEEEMAVNDATERFGKDLEPESYHQRFYGAYQLSRFFTTSFPLLSGTTLLVCVFFIATSGNYRAFFAGEMSALSYFLITLSVIGLGSVVFVVEKVKTSSLRTVFKSMAKNMRAPMSAKLAAIVCCIISISGSAWGIFSLTYAITDRSVQIEQGAIATVSGANAAFSGDSLRIVQQYQPLIQEKRNAVRNWDPKKYRTKRNILNNEATQLTDQMEAKIEQARQAADSKSSQAIDLRDKALGENEHKSSDAAWMAFITLVILEKANVFATRWNWIFRAKVYTEDTPAPARGTASHSPTPSEKLHITSEGEGRHASGFTPIGFRRPERKEATPEDKERKPLEVSVTHLHGAGYACTCTNCGTEYMRHRKPNEGERTFCSAKCRKQHERKRKRGAVADSG